MCWCGVRMPSATALLVAMRNNTALLEQRHWRRVDKRVQRQLLLQSSTTGDKKMFPGGHVVSIARVLPGATECQTAGRIGSLLIEAGHDHEIVMACHGYRRTQYRTGDAQPAVQIKPSLEASVRVGFKSKARADTAIAFLRTQFAGSGQVSSCLAPLSAHFLVSDLGTRREPRWLENLEWVCLGSYDSLMC
jgi:hypothetical protein